MPLPGTVPYGRSLHLKELLSTGTGRGASPWRAAIGAHTGTYDSLLVLYYSYRRMYSLPRLGCRVF